MKIIPTKLHDIPDNPCGIMLIASPWIFGFNFSGAAMIIPIVLGIMMLLGSLLTDYELGLIRVFSMRMHLFLDTLSALFLAFSPWIFGFYEAVYKPHLIIGMIQLLLALLSSTRPVPAEHL